MQKKLLMQAPKHRLTCPYCSRQIASPQMNRHKRIYCLERLAKAPLSELTYGEAKQSGRFVEWMKQEEVDNA